MKILHLTLTRGWFDMIASGVKPEEYREIKAYWIKRLTVGQSFNSNGELFDMVPVEYDIVRFKNGYAKDAPVMDVECKGITIGIGEWQWGASGKPEFIIKLGAIVSIANYAGPVEKPKF